MPLKTQATVLFGLTLGLTAAQCHLLWGVSASFVNDMSIRFDLARKKFVERRERKIKFGASDKGKTWTDVEADEVDLGKQPDPKDDTTALWEQWAGIVERGRPDSLVLFKTHPKKTKFRSPGPGPITKADWTPVATKWLKDKHVFLHTDGARSFKLAQNRKNKLSGVIHDYVVHKIKQDNQGRWRKPKYVQLFWHRLPDGRIVYTKGGTQIIDRVWGHVRKHVGRRSVKKTSKKTFQARVRSAQWLYWNAGKDLWLETGNTFSYLNNRSFKK